jgi:hypothetical protein
MSLVRDLYPHHRPPTEALPMEGRHDPASLVVCLPATVGHVIGITGLIGELIDRLRPHTVTPAGLLDAAHFVLWHDLDATEAALLVAPTPDPDLPGLTWCAGGPVGLLDLDATATHLRLVARRDLADWQQAVADTPPARPWWQFLDTHHADPDSYPLGRAMADFEAQPRIRAMAAAPHARFSADMYGPGLEALHAGPDVYAAYQAGLLAFTDGLVTLDGQLLVPSFTPVLVEQTLAERQTYHDRARRYLARLDPTTLLVAVYCTR